MSKSEDSIIASIRDLRLRIKYGTTYVAQSERKVGNLKGSFEILIEKFLKPRPQTIAFLENESLEQYSQTTKSRFLEFAFHLRLERNEEKMAAKIESISKENEELFKKEQSFLDMVNLLLSIQTIFGNSKNNIDYFTNIEKNNLIPNAQLWKIPKQIDIKLESLKSIELKQTNTTTTNMKTLTIGNDFIIFNDQELIRNCVFALMGVASIVFKSQQTSNRNSNEQQQQQAIISLITNKVVFVKRSNSNSNNDLVSPNLRKFAQSGSLFLKLRHFCDIQTSMSTSCQVVKTFFRMLETLLAEFVNRLSLNLEQTDQKYLTFQILIKKEINLIERLSELVHLCGFVDFQSKISGSHLLSILYNQCQNLLPKFLKECVERLFVACFETYSNFTIQWVYEGLLDDDKHNEFMIIGKTQTQQTQTQNIIQISQTKSDFVIQSKENVPSFLSDENVQMIFDCGSLIHMLKQQTHANIIEMTALTAWDSYRKRMKTYFESQSAENIDGSIPNPYQSAATTSISFLFEFIEKQHKILNEKALNLLWKHSLKQHFETFRNFHFMSNTGHVFQLFESFVVPKIRKGRMLANQLNDEFWNAVEQTNVNKQNLTLRKSMSMRYFNKQSLQISEHDFHNAIMLVYEIPWPCSIIFTTEVLDKQNRIFILLLRMKHANFAVNSGWTELKQHKDTREFLQIELLLSRMKNLLSIFETQTMDSMHGFYWKNFISNLSKFKTIRNLRENYGKMLEKLLEICFLNQKGKQIAVLFGQLLDIMSEFGLRIVPELCESFLRKRKQSETIVKDVKTNYEKYFELLLVSLSKEVQQNQENQFLEDLWSRLQ